jgi:hypothetical protein
VPLTNAVTLPSRSAQTLSLLLAILAGLITIAGCGGGGGGTGSQSAIVSITVAPATANVAINAQENFIATVKLANNTIVTDTSVTWLVNNTAGGSVALGIGTIVPDPTNPQVGVYTAPPSVPALNNGVVTITATAPQFPGGSSPGQTITSNSVLVTIGGGLGLVVVPGTANVPAGGNFQFNATLNNLPDPNATWSVSSTNGGAIGTINATTGIYSAPPSPPPGGVVTITAKDGANTATATATVIYSDASFSGPFAFSYMGNDSNGLLSVVGSLVSDGKGTIVSGVEDVESLLTGVSTQVRISGNYIVTGDGRGTLTLNPGQQTAATLRFVLTTNQHAALIRFDKNATAGGSMDQQNLNALTNSPTVLSGPYVFTLLGGDTSILPLGMAGRFTANAGNIPMPDTILDVNDNSAVTAEDRTLNGSYSFDATFPGTGRGTLSLTSATTGQRQFAFYVIDGTRFHMLETDSKAFVAGDAFAGLAGNAFTSADLPGPSYAFTTGGQSSKGAFTAGGAFSSGGTGSVTSGVLDTNNAETVTLATALSSCAYSVDSTTSRIALQLCAGGGNSEFAAYPTASGSAVMLEIDTTAVSTGQAFLQQVNPMLDIGSYAAILIGQGIFQKSPASYQQNTDAQLGLSAASFTGGTLDTNNFGNTFANNPVMISSSSITAPSAMTGRGTAVLVGTNPGVTYNLSYYLVNDTTVLLFDQDKTFILIGSVARQF